MSDHDSFWGACLDTGAQKCVIGKRQALAYCHQHGIAFKLNPSWTRFRFGSSVQLSLGRLPIRIPTPIGTFLHCEVDVVNAPVPLLLGLDFLDDICAHFDNVSNELRCEQDDWSLPLVRKFGHAFLEWDLGNVLFTKAEFVKVHRHFFHPSASKLFNLLRRARPADTTPDTRKVLEDISKSCSTCQEMAPRPLRFKVSLSEDKLVFNQELALDVMFIDGRPLLHIVDVHTGFSNVSFLAGQSVEDIWKAFVHAWVLLYIGFPSQIRADQAKVFKSDRWKRLTEAAGRSLQLSGVESHNSLGVGERYHAPLRRIYRKVRLETPNLPADTAIRLANKVMNDTAGPNGLVPSLLVFGVLPRDPCVNSSLPSQRDRMKALECARREMATIVAELRIQEALRSRVPRAADHVIHPGDSVRVYREKEAKFTGLFRVVEVIDEQIFIDRNGTKVQQNISQVLPDRVFTEDYLLDELQTMFAPFCTQSSHSKKKNPEAPNGPALIHITEVLPSHDSRSSLPQFDEARQKELQGLFEKGTWKVVYKDEVPDDANVLGGRFVLTIKNAETDNPVFKARFVVQGHTDRGKGSLVHTSTTMRQSSIRVLTALAATFGFRIWSHDVSQAYLQSADNLLRDVYVKLTAEFQLGPDQLLKLLRPLYGLPDSGDHWHMTFDSHIREDLGMQRAHSDLSLFYKHVHDKLVGLGGTYVDDSIFAGQRSFEKDTDKTLEKFESRDRIYDDFEFAGIEVQNTEKGVVLHQRKQAEKLRILEDCCGYREFKSRLMQTAWIVHTRPEIACAVAQLAQVTDQRFTSESVKLLNKAIMVVKSQPSRGLCQQQLDKNSLSVRVYTDSSFANNLDSSSQLGYLVLLCDGSNKCNILHYKSYKSRRVTRSVLGAEVHAFADGFDCGYITKHDIERMLGRSIPLVMMTDSKSLFDVITKSSSTLQRRLMIDISAAREAYQRGDISDVAHVRSEYNPADAFTKICHCPALERVVMEGVVDHPVAQWIIREFPTRNDYEQATFATERGECRDVHWS